MAKPVYFIRLSSEDEDGKVNPGFVLGSEYDDWADGNLDALNGHLVDFLSQTDFSYINSDGWVVEVYDGNHQVFGRYVDDVSNEAMNKYYEQIRSYGREEDISIIKKEYEAKCPDIIAKDSATKPVTKRRLPNVPEVQNDNQIQLGE